MTPGGSAGTAAAGHRVEPEEDEMRSRVYGWLSDRTSRADGSEWEHGALRVAVDELLGILK